MSAWGWFTGGDKARKQANETAAANKGYISDGLTAQTGYMREARDSGRGYLQPYADAGRRGQTTYENMLGNNGADAQSSSQAAYQTFNPYLQAEQGRMQQSLDRRAAATGQFGSGLNALAKARAVDESGFRNFSDYMNRQQGLGQQGFQAAGAMAGNDWNYANGASAAQQGATQGYVNNNTQLGNALSAANISPLNFLMQNANMAISALSGRPGGNNFSGR